jgi:hypothetical protein
VWVVLLQGQKLRAGPVDGFVSEQGFAEILGACLCFFPNAPTKISDTRASEEVTVGSYIIELERGCIAF